MNYQDFIRQVEQAGSLTQARRLREAEDVIYKLIMGDVSDLDKADLCAMIADVYDREGKTEDALIWFDKGITYEKGYLRFDVSMKKAEYLAQLGRREAAMAIYEEILRQPYTKEIDRDHLRKEIQALLGRSLGDWK